MKIGADVLIVRLATQVVIFGFSPDTIRRARHLIQEGKVRIDAGGGRRTFLKAVYISRALILAS